MRIDARFKSMYNSILDVGCANGEARVLSGDSHDMSRPTGTGAARPVVACAHSDNALRSAAFSWNGLHVLESM